jgi:hypothetical protein
MTQWRGVANTVQPLNGTRALSMQREIPLSDHTSTEYMGQPSPVREYSYYALIRAVRPEAINGDN